MFDEAGLWSCTAITRARSTSYSGNDGVVLYLSVRRPDGSVYDELQDDKQLANGSGSLILTAPFLVPEPGYQLHALVCQGMAVVRRRHPLSRLFAVKHDNRLTNRDRRRCPMSQIEWQHVTGAWKITDYDSREDPTRYPNRKPEGHMHVQGPLRRDRSR
ncbi:hypothetical protein GS444_10710 [Rhodococcus hoagii]|nr:hypothetical protein [Prescottella equi]